MIPNKCLKGLTTSSYILNLLPKEIIEIIFVIIDNNCI